LFLYDFNYIVFDGGNGVRTLAPMIKMQRAIDSFLKYVIKTDTLVICSSFFVLNTFIKQ